MKKASSFEKVAARCWNLLNEGKPFTPIFTIGTMLIYSLSKLGIPFLQFRSTLRVISHLTSINYLLSVRFSVIS